MTINSSSGIACPTCKSTACTVKDSRPKQDGLYIRRRRLCDSCGHRFTTEERAVTEDSEQFAGLEVYRALMQKAKELEALAKTIMTPRRAQGLANRADAPPAVQVGAVSAQALGDEDA